MRSIDRAGVSSFSISRLVSFFLRHEVHMYNDGEGEVRAKYSYSSSSSTFLSRNVRNTYFLCSPPTFFFLLWYILLLKLVVLYGMSSLTDWRIALVCVYNFTMRKEEKLLFSAGLLLYPTDWLTDWSLLFLFLLHEYTDDSGMMDYLLNVAGSTKRVLYAHL